MTTQEAILAECRARADWYAPIAGDVDELADWLEQEYVEKAEQLRVYAGKPWARLALLDGLRDVRWLDIAVSVQNAVAARRMNEK